MNPVSKDLEILHDILVKYDNINAVWCVCHMMHNILITRWKVPYHRHSLDSLAVQFVYLFVVLFLFHSIWLERSKYKKEKKKNFVEQQNSELAPVGSNLTLWEKTKPEIFK